MDMGLSGLQELVGQGSLACYGSWDRKESDTTEWLNWTDVLSTDLEALFVLIPLILTKIQ